MAEVVSYGRHHLRALGLGEYIAQAAAVGVFPKVLSGQRTEVVHQISGHPAAWTGGAPG